MISFFRSCRFVRLPGQDRGIAPQVFFQRLVICSWAWMLLAALGCKPSTRPSSDTDKESIVREAERNGVQLSIEVKPKKPRLSDLVSLQITITYPKSIHVELPAFGQSVGDFAIRDYAERKASQTDSDSSNEKKVIRYQLEPMFSGRHLIRSIPIIVVEDAASDSPKRDLLQSDPIEVDVSSEFGSDAPELSQVDPMISPLDGHSNRYFWTTIFGLCGLVLAACLAWLGLRRRKTIVPLRVVTPEEVARRALDQLIAEQLPSKGLVKEFYLRLTGIVRFYIEGKTGIKAPEQTTEEFLRDMRTSHHFDGPQSNRLQEFLTAADLVKYAGQQPDEASIEKSVSRAQEFIAMQFSPIESFRNESIEEVRR